MRLGLLDSPAGAENNRLVRIDNSHPQRAAVSQGLRNHGAEMMEVDDDVTNAMPLQEQQIPDDHRGAGDRQKRFRCGIGQRPQPGTEACCEDHRFHNEW